MDEETGQAQQAPSDRQSLRAMRRAMRRDRESDDIDIVGVDEPVAAPQPKPADRRASEAEDGRDNKDDKDIEVGIEMSDTISDLPAGDRREERIRRRENKQDASEAPNDPNGAMEAAGGGARATTAEDKSRDRERERDRDAKDKEEPPSEPLKPREIHSGPLKVLEPVRTDPVKALQARQRRIERLSATKMPEVHMVGQILCGQGLITDPSEGASCRWKVEFGKAWQCLGGEVVGQTHIAYPMMLDKERVPFNHPIDLHFAEAGLQGWGAPRICFQSYKMDSFGRRILTGYGFAHLPVTPGFHRIEIALWRPAGSPEQEMDAMIMGRVPALVTAEPLYETAWRERCRLVTIGAGRVELELFVMTRFMKSQGIDNASA